MRLLVIHTNHFLVSILGLSQISQSDFLLNVTNWSDCSLSGSLHCRLVRFCEFRLVLSLLNKFVFELLQLGNLEVLLLLIYDLRLKLLVLLDGARFLYTRSLLAEHVAHIVKLDKARVRKNCPVLVQ